MPKTPVKDVVKAQKKITRDAFTDKCQQALVQIAEQGLNAKLFYENPDEKTYISVVPVRIIIILNRLLEIPELLNPPVT